MILANKLSTALELLGRVQLGYSYLPKWLKSATVNINKGELTFSNRSSIRAFASSSDAARGFSCNCVSGKTLVEVRRKWNPFSKKKVTIKDFIKPILDELGYSNSDMHSEVPYQEAFIDIKN